MSKDQRAYPRVQREGLALLRKKRFIFFNSSELEVRVVDMSRTGLGLLADVELAAGEIVELMLSAKNSAKKDPLQGKVMWHKRLD